MSFKAYVSCRQQHAQHPLAPGVQVSGTQLHDDQVLNEHMKGHVNCVELKLNRQFTYCSTLKNEGLPPDLKYLNTKMDQQ